jgi:hypothetical protein
MPPGSTLGFLSLRPRRVPPRRPPTPAEALGAPAPSRPALLVAALAPRLRSPVDPASVLPLLAGGMDAVPGSGPEARLARLVLRMSEQAGLNARPPATWTPAERRRVFDPDWLVRPAAGDPALAGAAEALWRAAARALRAAGHDPAALALAAMGAVPAPGDGAPNGSGRGSLPARRRTRPSGMGQSLA